MTALPIPPVLKCLTSGADATHEAVAIEVARAIAAMDVPRGLDCLARRCGQAKFIRGDVGKAFCSKAMVAWHPRVA